ncbi:MAG: hypothetical protein AABM67_11640 [Acidobacteriota bacterium]
MRKLEVICGIATGLSAVIVTIIVKCPSFSNDIVGNVIYIGLALLVPIGAYLHSGPRRTAGLILLLTGGIPIFVISVGLGLAGGLFLFCGLREGLLILTPSALAILTMIVSIFSLLGERKGGFLW